VTAPRSATAAGAATTCTCGCLTAVLLCDGSLKGGYGSSPPMDLIDWPSLRMPAPTLVAVNRHQPTLRWDLRCAQGHLG
jgi:hypothetical protein